MTTVYLNISDEYGDKAIVTVADYLELNPDGEFEEIAMFGNDTIMSDGIIIAIGLEDSDLDDDEIVESVKEQVGEDGLALMVSALYGNDDVVPEELEGSTLQAVMTPAQIEAEFELSAGTVRQYLRRHGDNLVLAKIASKPDERTWLLTRRFAERTWRRK